MGGMLRRNWRSVFIVLMLGVDTIALALSGVASLYLRRYSEHLPNLDTSTVLQYVMFFGCTTLTIGTIVGVYRSAFHLTASKQYFLASKAYFYSIVFVLASLYAFQSGHFPRRFTLIFFAVLPVAFIAGRYVLGRLDLLFRRFGLGIHRSLVVVDGTGWQEVTQRVMNIPALGYDLVGRISCGQHTGGAQPEALDVDESHLPLFHVDEVPALIHEMRIERIIVPSLAMLQNGCDELMRICERSRVKLKVLSDESEDLLRFAAVRDLAGITLVLPPRRRIEAAKRIVKRLFDIIFATLAIIMLSPLFLLIMVLVLLEDGRPIFFTQKRALVKAQNEFDFYKFRSMRRNAEEKQQELYRLNKTTGGLFHVESDPRLTRIGRVIRKHSIDELPQLFNVIKGDMSVVGPRPLMIADLENITPANALEGYYRLRANAKPGMTGLWQISGRREVPFREMVLLDLYYIENQSLAFDLEILFATIPVVLFGKGAY